MKLRIFNPSLKPVSALIISGFYILVSCQSPMVHTSQPTEKPQTSSAFSKTIHKDADVAIDWYKLQLRIFLYSSPQISPLVVARNLGYVGVGLYESVRHGINGSVSFSESLYQMPPMPGKEKNNDYAWDISANAALAELVRSLYANNLTVENKTSIDSLENAYNEKHSPTVRSEVFKRSQVYGRAVAKAIFDWSKTDNTNLSGTGYAAPSFPGSWAPTPDGFAAPAGPYLGLARPFLEANLRGSDQAFPFTYSEDPSSDFYKMVKDVYDVSQTLTNDQRTIALYWDDIGTAKGYTPPGHAFSIITQVLENRQADLSWAAQVYAKAGVAIRDAFILCWRGKYKYCILRPVTYIRKVINPNWLPLINTPSHPEYFAAHAFITAAPMQVLTKLVGDNFEFTDNTYKFLGFTPRSFSSFNAIATEAGISRRYGGIHYMPSIQTGLMLGKECGEKAANIKLTQ